MNWGNFAIHSPPLTTFYQRSRNNRLIRIHSLKKLQQTDWLSAKKLVTFNLYFQMISLILYSAPDLIMFPLYPENHPGYVYCHLPPPPALLLEFIFHAAVSYCDIIRTGRDKLFPSSPSLPFPFTWRWKQAHVPSSRRGTLMTAFLRLSKEFRISVGLRSVGADSAWWCVHTPDHLRCFILLLVHLFVGERAFWAGFAVPTTVCWSPKQQQICSSRSQHFLFLFQRFSSLGSRLKAFIWKFRPQAP